MDFLTKLADMAGVTHVVTENYSRAATGTNRIVVKNIDMWKQAVGKAKITESKSILEATYDDRQIGQFNTDSGEGWLDGDVDSNKDSGRSDGDNSASDNVDTSTSSSGKRIKTDIRADDVDNDLDRDEDEDYDSADSLILSRQLEDLHRQCSAEVEEITNQFKRTRQFGSRSDDEIEDILELYKDLYVILFNKE